MLHRMQHAPRCRGAGGSRAQGRTVSPRSVTSERARPGNATRSGDKVIALELSDVGDRAPIVFYLPGTDGSGQAIQPQVPALRLAGLSVRSLYIPPSNRSSWDELVDDLIPLVREAVEASGAPVILLAESFGACLALRFALREPQLLRHLVIINSATSFGQSLGGVSAAVTSTNLLGLFPEPLYNAAQAVLMPLLLDRTRTSDDVAGSVRAMLAMADTPNGAGPSNSSVFHQPAAAANFRLNMMISGNMDDDAFARIMTPTLLICAAQDRLLPSFQEGARLQRLMPNAKRLTLPNSGHAPMLETGVCLVDLLREGGVLPPAPEAARVPSAFADGGITLPDLARPLLQTSALFNGLSGDGNGAALLSVSAGVPAEAAVGTPPAAPQPRGSPPARPAAAAATAAAAAEPGSMSAPATARGGVSPRNASPGVDVGAPSPSASNGAGPRVARMEGSYRYNVGVVDEEYENGIRTFGWWRDLISPVVVGEENIPRLADLNGRPLLFVGNHTQFGLYDLSLFFMEMYFRGIVLTGLAHAAHWNGPMGAFFERFGAVKASPMAAYRALKQGRNVLLFPGGGREVVKRKGEQYKLLWKADVDFVRLARKCNAIIVPFAAVGADDAYDLWMDTDELLVNPVLGPLISEVSRRVQPKVDPKEAVFPITTVPGTGIPSPLPVPNFQRVYFKIGQPVDTAACISSATDKDACERVYHIVRECVEQQIQELLQVRATDPDSSAPSRFRRFFSLINPFAQ